MTALSQVTQVLTDSLPSSPAVNSFSVVGTLIELVGWMAAIAIGAYAHKVGELVMAWNRWLDTRPASQKQLLIGFLSFLGMKASQILGVPITDLHAFIAAVTPYLFKLGDQAKSAREAAEKTIPLEDGT